MDENKNLENEIAEETAEEVAAEEVIAEEAVEEVATEEVIAEETVEEVATEEVIAEEAVEEVATEEVIEEAKKGSKAGAVIAAIVAVIIVAVAVVTSMMDFNKYNKMGYVDISGKTIQDIADSQGITLAEFLKAYQLPEDMPGDTIEAAAYYMIPAGVVAEMNGLDFETLKSMLKLPEGVTAETPWGEAEGGILLADYIGGADKVEAFKAQYGFGDEVTAETPWRELRNAVDTAALEERKAQEAAAAQEAETSEEEIAE